MNESPSAPQARATTAEYLHACPVCLHTDLAHYCRVPSLFTPGQFIRYERCRGCGTVIRNPRLPAPDRLTKYVEKVLDPSEKELQPKTQTHYAYMMRVIHSLMSDDSSRRLLDFGCGQGGFLVEAQSSGFDVMGLELNRDLASHVTAEYGIPVYQGLVSDPEFQSERFNLILTSQVFEHLLDPRETLHVLRGLLEPPGILLIEVPTLLDIRERVRRGALMDDSHLFYFTPKSLCAMLENAAFRVLRVEDGLRPYSLLPGTARRSPLWALYAAQRVMSILQVRTGLSVIAELK